MIRSNNNTNASDLNLNFDAKLLENIDSDIAHIIDSFKRGKPYICGCGNKIHLYKSKLNMKVVSTETSQHQLDRLCNVEIKNIKLNW